MPSYKALLVSALTLASAGLASAQTCTHCDASVTFVNFHNITTDGSASAIIEGSKCPVLLNQGEKNVYVDNAAPSQSTQKYYVDVYGQQCTFNGTATGSTFTCLDASGKLNQMDRFYEDEHYNAAPCPAGCEATCKQLDPNWASDAKAMFVWKWKAGAAASSSSGSVSSTGATSTGGASSTGAVTSGNGSSATSKPTKTCGVKRTTVTATSTKTASGTISKAKVTRRAVQL